MKFEINEEMSTIFWYEFFTNENRKIEATLAAHFKEMGENIDKLPYSEYLAHMAISDMVIRMTLFEDKEFTSSPIMKGRHNAFEHITGAKKSLYLKDYPFDCCRILDSNLEIVDKAMEDIRDIKKVIEEKDKCEELVKRNFTIVK